MEHATREKRVARAGVQAGMRKEPGRSRGLLTGLVVLPLYAFAVETMAPVASTFSLVPT
jgi:hypothetical protein